MKLLKPEIDIMNVFISWSGETSRKLAKTFSEWLPTVLQNINVFYSPDDIRKGEFWTSRVREELKSNITGILFLTKSNRNNPWILFESGALANGIGKGKIFPILFDFEIGELINPLALFNATKFDKEDIRKLIHTINSDFGEIAVQEERVNKIFEKFWIDLEKEIIEILKTDISKNESILPPKESEMQKESLSIQKQIIKYLSEGDKPNFSTEFKTINNQLAVIENRISLLDLNKKNVLEFSKSNSRPIALNAHLYRFNQDGTNMISFVSRNENGNPVEVFIFPEDNEMVPIPKSIKKGQIVTQVEGWKDYSGYAFVYIDKYGYENIIGGLDKMVQSDVYNQTLLINSILANSIGFNVVFEVINIIKAKEKTPLAIWKKSIIKILSKYKS